MEGHGLTTKLPHGSIKIMDFNFLQNPLREDNEIMKNKEDVRTFSTKLGTLIFFPFELRCCYNFDYCKKLWFIWAMWPAGVFFFWGGGFNSLVFLFISIIIYNNWLLIKGEVYKCMRYILLKICIYNLFQKKPQKIIIHLYKHRCLNEFLKTKLLYFLLIAGKGQPFNIA